MDVSRAKTKPRWEPPARASQANDPHPDAPLIVAAPDAPASAIAHALTEPAATSPSREAPRPRRSHGLLAGLFHRRRRCLVILDLKLDKLTHAEARQMHLCLNYAREHWMVEVENPPVGLILCGGVQLQLDDAVVTCATAAVGRPVATRVRRRRPARRGRRRHRLPTGNQHRERRAVGRLANRQEGQLHSAP